MFYKWGMIRTVPGYVPLTRAKARVLARARELWQVHDQAERAAAAFEGSLAWRPVRGGERLVRVGPASRLDRRRSHADLGPRSPETEALLSRHLVGAAESRRHREAARAALSAQARANVNAGLGRLPAPAGRLLRSLWFMDMLGPDVRLKGAGALLTYEAAGGGVLVPPDGEDPLGSLTAGLAFACRPEAVPRMLSAAEAAGFRRSRVPGRAVDAGGFSVDALVDGPEGFLVDPPRHCVVVDAEGWPAPLAAPPPRAFVAERFRTGGSGDLDDDSAMALSQARCAVACPP